MPARLNAIPSVKLTTWLPGDLHGKMTLFLFSELEGRVPKSAYKDFLSARIREYFDHKRLDLAPYLPGLDSNTVIISGSEQSIELLKRLLSK